MGLRVWGQGLTIPGIGLRDLSLAVKASIGDNPKKVPGPSILVIYEQSTTRVATTGRLASLPTRTDLELRVDVESYIYTL